MIKYVDLIEKGKQQFKKELESIMPEVKLGDKKGIMFIDYKTGVSPLCSESDPN